jgi:hypothetical protein
MVRLATALKNLAYSFLLHPAILVVISGCSAGNHKSVAKTPGEDLDHKSVADPPGP